MEFITCGTHKQRAGDDASARWYMQSFQNSSLPQMARLRTGYVKITMDALIISVDVLCDALRLFPKTTLTLRGSGMPYARNHDVWSLAHTVVLEPSVALALVETCFADAACRPLLALMAAKGHDAVIRGILEHAILDVTYERVWFEGFVCCARTRLVAQHDLESFQTRRGVLEWTRVYDAVRGGRVNLVVTRIVMENKEVIVQRARGAGIQDIVAALFQPFVLHAAGEALEPERTLEAYGIDDETPLEARPEPRRGRGAEGG